ncbi:hypothetical protein ACHAXT_006461 [Thalassiosira profunda]
MGSAAPASRSPDADGHRPLQLRRHRRSIVAAFFLVHCVLACSVDGFSVGSGASRSCERRQLTFDMSGRTLAPPSSLSAKKPSADKEEEADENRMMGLFKKSPGTLIIVPFVLLFGLDLVLNIAVVTKRSLEVFFTGEYTELPLMPWQ